MLQRVRHCLYAGALDNGFAPGFENATNAAHSLYAPAATSKGAGTGAPRS
jgi:hypothetical protein